MTDLQLPIGTSFDRPRCEPRRRRMALAPPRPWLLVLALAGLVIACGGPSASAAPPGSPAASATVAESASAAAAPTDGPALTFVMFGDSWPYGAHCNGCRPFPALLADEYATTTGHSIDFRNDTTNGGTAQELAARMTTDGSVRDDIEAAAIIVISIGANDLESAIQAAAERTCGGTDGLDCFRTAAASLRTSYDGILAEIDELRGDRPTAVRMVTTSNEFLADAGLIELLGADFGASAGVAITTMNRDVECEIAEAHHRACVDLGLALNGADLLTPKDVNTQQAMQEVADTIAAAGLEELGR